jgi:hypothetical protein
LPQRVKKVGKKPGSGATAMRRAYELLLQRKIPPDAIQRAVKVVKWIPDRHKPGELIPVTLQEDLFGVFDFLIISPVGTCIGLQVTTWTGGGGVAARRKKIDEWMERAGVLRIQAQVWAWVPRKHFRTWVLDDGSWRELSPSTPLKRKGAAR